MAPVQYYQTLLWYTVPESKWLHSNFQQLSRTCRRTVGDDQGVGTATAGAASRPQAFRNSPRVLPISQTMRGTSTALLAVLALLFATAVLAEVEAHEQDSVRDLRSRWRMRHKHKRHREPDRRRPQRKFRGGRVRHPMFEGSGCPSSSVELVNASDSSVFALSALFSQFQAQTSSDDRRVRKTCTITVVLEPEEGMTIGVSHVDFRGNAYVPEPAVSTGNNRFTSEAKLAASYRLGRSGRQRIADRTYPAGWDDDVYEELEVNPIAWTPCGNTNRPRGTDRVFEFRITATITAMKRARTDADVAIAIDTSDATLQKGLYYELTTKRCGQADPEPPVTDAPTTEPLATEPPGTDAPTTEPPATEPLATESPANESVATEAPSGASANSGAQSLRGSGDGGSSSGENVSDVIDLTANPKVGSPSCSRVRRRF